MTRPALLLFISGRNAPNGSKLGTRTRTGFMFYVKCAKCCLLLSKDVWQFVIKAQLLWGNLLKMNPIRTDYYNTNTTCYEKNMTGDNKKSRCVPTSCCNLGLVTGPESNQEAKAEQKRLFCSTPTHLSVGEIQEKNTSSDPCTVQFTVSGSPCFRTVFDALM